MPHNDDGDFADLLGDAPSPEEKQALEELQDGGQPVETPEQARIRVLEEKLERALAAQSAPRLSSDDEFRNALSEVNRIASAPDAYEDDDGETLTIHFLDDGLTLSGRVWEKGQTVSYVIGGRAYEETKDRNGRTWLADISHEAQIRRWGRIRVGLGPYPKPLNLPDEVIDPEEKLRGTRAPVVLR